MFLLLVLYYNFIHHGNGVIFIVLKDVIFYLKQCRKIFEINQIKNVKIKNKLYIAFEICLQYLKEKNFLRKTIVRNHKLSISNDVEMWLTHDVTLLWRKNSIAMTWIFLHGVSTRNDRTILFGRNNCEFPRVNKTNNLLIDPLRQLSRFGWTERESLREGYETKRWEFVWFYEYRRSSCRISMVRWWIYKLRQRLKSQNGLLAKRYFCTLKFYFAFFKKLQKTSSHFFIYFEKRFAFCEVRVALEIIIFSQLNLKRFVLKFLQWLFQFYNGVLIL